jgi:hypothetical protein
MLTDLEIGLRAHCRKLRVIEKLSGGAQLLFPGESSLAVRAYYPSDLDALQGANPHPQTMDGLHGKEEQVQQQDTDDLEGLGAFQSAFRTTVLFFVLPHDVLAEQLDNPDSFLHRANRVLHASSEDCAQSCSILTVPDTATAIAALTTIADAMAPAKRALRREFVERQLLACFLPDDASGFPHPNADGQAAMNGASAFREWAELFELPPGEADVLMSIMGTLENIVTGDYQALTRAPLEDRSKEILHGFFESQAGGTVPGRSVGGFDSNPQTTGQVNAPPVHQGPSYHQQQTPSSHQAFAYQNRRGSGPQPVQTSQHLASGSSAMGNSSYQQSTAESFARPDSHAYAAAGQPQMAYHQGPTPAANRRLMHRYM